MLVCHLEPLETCCVDRGFNPKSHFLSPFCLTQCHAAIRAILRLSPESTPGCLSHLNLDSRYKEILVCHLEPFKTCCMDRGFKPKSHFFSQCCHTQCHAAKWQVHNLSSDFALVSWGSSNLIPGHYQMLVCHLKPSETSWVDRGFKPKSLFSVIAAAHSVMQQNDKSTIWAQILL